MKKLYFLVVLLISISAQNSKSQDFINNKSEEEIAFDILRPTINKWLRGNKIKSEVQGDSDFSFHPFLIDVNADGKKELAIKNGCAPVGNCQLWLFKKRGNKYEIILKSLPAAVQTFKFKTTKTKDYFDLETKDHGDAWSGEIDIYKFNGKEYKLSRCSRYNYSYLENGKLYELKKPRITPIKCSY